MNYIEMIMKLLVSHGQQVFDPKEIGHQILSVLRKILKSLIILLIGSVIFCLLMGYLIDRLLGQLDQGSFALTPSISLLIVLIVMDAFILRSALRKVVEDKESEVETQTSSTTSPVEMALAALILDFVKERENNREAKNENGQPARNHPQE